MGGRKKGGGTVCPRMELQAQSFASMSLTDVFFDVFSATTICGCFDVLGRYAVGIEPDSCGSIKHGIRALLYGRPDSARLDVLCSCVNLALRLRAVQTADFGDLWTSEVGRFSCSDLNRGGAYSLSTL